jgi:hypothetical protein
VAWKNRGLLLAGEGGAGKSSLSLALAQAGLDFLSDDRTLVRNEDGRLTAWGLSAEMKQRPEAISHFPELKDLGCSELWKRDPAYRFNPSRTFKVSLVRSCEPQWIVFLERHASPALSLEEMPSADAALRLQRDLLQETPEAAELQLETIEALSRKPCYVLRFGGNPHTVAGALQHLFMNGVHPNGESPSPLASAFPRAPVPASDPLRRFGATCMRADVQLMGRHIRIETDNPAILSQVRKVLGRSEPATGPPQYLWRIVGESGDESDRAWPAMTAFSHGSLRYVSLGQRSFAAADLHAHEAVCVLNGSLCEDEIRFPTLCLASMLRLSAPALGLIAAPAACVAKGQNGLLLFGPPDSGKTTASYCGKQLGLEFHSDQASFLELDGGSVYAWSDFWPVAFRPETAKYFPEVEMLARPFSCRDRTLLWVDKAALGGTVSGRVNPAACVFLERGASSRPRLIPLHPEDLPRQVVTDSSLLEDRNAMLGLLSRLPAYRLLYDDDPGIAARFCRSVLDAHQRMEHRV